MKSKKFARRHTMSLLRAICKEYKMTKREYRLNTLKYLVERLDYYITVRGPFIAEDREFFVSIRDSARLAIGDE
jgi:hypothetical protein